MTKRQRIGLLGGSFNPAHRGHLHITHTALERLRLDSVWWLVSPQNPLKDSDGMASHEERMSGASAVADDSRIHVSDIERDLGTRYTVDTLRALKKRHPEHRFVWLMGADNLLQLPRWKNWATIFRLVPVAIFPRPSYSKRALTGAASRRFARHQVREYRAPTLTDMHPPAWIFLRMRPDATSATRIREATQAK
jgi:nicotinate-nucleotide adenylyltransferase